MLINNPETMLLTLSLMRRNELLRFGLGLARPNRRGGGTPQNVTALARLRCAMLEIDRSDEILEGEFVDLDEPACAELVPVTRSVRLPPRLAPRPDPTFIAQLIATADHAPQTCRLRRASPADAQTAYGASQARRFGTGFRTRQTI